MNKDQHSSLLGLSFTPTLPEWQELWRQWDQVTSAQFICHFDTKPISLRHPFIFYVGHVPCFCDMLLSRCLNEPLTDPQAYSSIFERGIDPVVEDPSICHSHSEVPEEWPKLEEILHYKAQVRMRIAHLYQRIDSKETFVVPLRRLERVLHLVFEHEAMHSETLCYMLTKSDYLHYLSPKPKHFTVALDVLEPAKWLKIDQRCVEIGLDEDKEELDFAECPSSNHRFGWDNESPARQAHVDSFQIQHRPLSVQEYFEFLKSFTEIDQKLIPASFQHGKYPDEKFLMKSLYGPIPLSQCSHFPIALSYTQAEAYMKYLQRELGDETICLPSEEQLTAFYQQYQHTVNRVNIGFQNFCLVPLNEEVHVFGSVWEWTSTVMQEHKNFIKSEIYPGYSFDFFDGLHNIVLGGSWATHPRQVGRLRNFYQRSYPYAFIGVRFAKNI